MPTVIGVRFRNAGRRQYALPGQYEFKLGDPVIINTNQGQEYATVCQTAADLPDEMLQHALQVTRPAHEGDKKQLENNQKKEQQAFSVCRERILAHKLDMKLVSVEYAFDGSKLTASFTSGGRVDFRALVKDLAGIFKTRIELKQIGVRDEAKSIGGVGSCGRGLCCSNFLYEFQPVSIRMAKEQSLSLNPTKISGVCGRLMCCLKYEQDQYEKARKRLPRLGKEVITPKGRGIVTQVNALLENVSVRILNGDNADIHVFTAEQVQRVNPPQAKPEGKAPAKQRLVEEEPVTEADEEFMVTHVVVDEDEHSTPDDD